MQAIRSYVRRQGRMIPAQRRAIDELWAIYGVSEGAELDLEAIFGRQAPCHLEIGFGMGDALLEMAQTNPDLDYLGVEVHLPGVGQLLLRLEEIGLSNVRIASHDAVDLLECLPDESIEKVNLFFPDPWLKKRHHKRRLVQPAFIGKLRQVLKPGGVFHAATDWDDYAWHMIDVLDGAKGFSNLAVGGKFYPRPDDRPVTKFELRGLNRGHKVRDLLYKRL